MRKTIASAALLAFLLKCKAIFHISIETESSSGNQLVVYLGYVGLRSSQATNYIPIEDYAGLQISKVTGWSRPNSLILLCAIFVLGE